jgi:hypothetical protein
MIDTAKCHLPLDVCLASPEFLPLLGCSGDGLPLQVCLDFPHLLTEPACAGFSLGAPYKKQSCLDLT